MSPANEETSNEIRSDEHCCPGLTGCCSGICGQHRLQFGAAPESSWQPQLTLKAKLQAKGLTIRNFKEEGGCYEVYAVDKPGPRVNEAFSAECAASI